MAQAAQIAGNLIQGVAGYEAGKYNQRAAETEAVEAARAGASEEARIREAARQQMGEQIAAQAGGGFAIGTGSALDALEQSQVNAALDALTVRREAAMRSRAARAQGAIARAHGNNALTVGMMGAASAGIDWASQRRALAVPAASTPRSAPPPPAPAAGKGR